MRILTVRQPWAWAIIHGGKDVENRVRNIAGDYRGPVAIHVGLSYDTAWSSVWMFEAMNATGVHSRADVYPWHENHGAIIGVVDLMGVHSVITAPNGRDHCEVAAVPTEENETGACSRWAERSSVHLMLRNPRALAEPIPYRGALGLRRLEADVVAQIQAVLA